MTIILRDIPIQLTAEAVLLAVRRNRPLPPNPAFLQAAEKAIAMSEPLLRPTAVCAEFHVRQIADGRAFLSTGAGADAGDLTIGPKADLLAPAERVIAAVATIGSALERCVHELTNNGDALLAFMLDSVGVMALGVVGEAVRTQTHKHAEEMGWGVGPALAPGSLVGWPMQGQRELCALLPLEEIGVRLTEYCVLQPHKSTSMLIGLGPGYDSRHAGSICRFCSLANTCWRRREGG